jgi:hypothetical protein
MYYLQALNVLAGAASSLNSFFERWPDEAQSDDKH